MFVRCSLLTAAVVLFGFLLVFRCLVVTSFACGLGMGILDSMAVLPYPSAVLSLFSISHSVPRVLLLNTAVEWVGACGPLDNQQRYTPHPSARRTLMWC